MMKRDSLSRLSWIFHAWTNTEKMTRSDYALLERDWGAHYSFSRLKRAGIIALGLFSLKRSTAAASVIPVRVLHQKYVTECCCRIGASRGWKIFCHAHKPGRWYLCISFRSTAHREWSTLVTARLPVARLTILDRLVLSICLVLFTWYWLPVNHLKMYASEKKQSNDHCIELKILCLWILIHKLHTNLL